jgi:hypothetical protein
MKYQAYPMTLFLVLGIFLYYNPHHLEQYLLSNHEEVELNEKYEKEIQKQQALNQHYKYLIQVISSRKNCGTRLTNADSKLENIFEIAYRKMDKAYLMKDLPQILWEIPGKINTRSLELNVPSFKPEIRKPRGVYYFKICRRLYYNHAELELVKMHNHYLKHLLATFKRIHDKDDRLFNTNAFSINLNPYLLAYSFLMETA